MKFTEVSRGIPHIEDLPVSDIIETLANINDYQITEKVDGAQILFGIDEIGFYTSRETKGGTRIYNEGSYGMTFPSTYMRSTHKLLEQVLPILRGSGLGPGDQVEAEVLYGELPNVVPYSADTNYLIFLRTTEGNVNIDRLQQKLDGQSISISLVAPHTDDGRTIEFKEETNNWKFSRVPIIERKGIALSIRRNIIREMMEYLASVDILTKQTYGTILEIPLNKIPEWIIPGTWKEIKEHIKQKKIEIQSILLEKQIMPAKEVFLDHYVRNTASSFGPLVEDGGWIEGVVLRHKLTGKMVKLVDKNVFGEVREQAWARRNMITESAKGIENPHSFLGKLMVNLATSFGHPELGTMQAKNYLRRIGKTTEERLDILSENFNFNSVRNYWDSLLKLHNLFLEGELDNYAKETAINEGIRRIFAKAIRNRTLESFAQTFEKVSILRGKTLQAKNSTDLIIALVGKQLGEL